jgi:hypothetical protein
MDIEQTTGTAENAQVGDAVVALALVAAVGAFVMAFRVSWAFSKSRGAPALGMVAGLLVGAFAGLVSMILVVMIGMGEIGPAIPVAIGWALVFLALKKARDLTIAPLVPPASASVGEVSAIEPRYSPTLVYPLGATDVKPIRGTKGQGERREPKRTRKPRSAEVIDVIRFEYEDRSGDMSAREVEVTAISDEYFEGWCRGRKAARTFRLDRVSGEVVSLETGEIDDPYAWAGEHMDDERNDGIDEERWFGRSSH